MITARAALLAAFLVASCTPGHVDFDPPPDIAGPPIGPIDWTPAVVPSSDVGTLPGRLGVDRKGRATYRIPLKVPPGPNGLAPRLALTYNSGGGNGLLGVGWSLRGVSKIARCPRNRFQDGMRAEVAFAQDDAYCLDGQRLVPVRGESGADGTAYRLQENENVKIVSHGGRNGPDRFTAHHPDGTTVTYGARITGRRVSSDRPDGTLAVDPAPSVYAWGVSLIRDPSRHALRVRWGHLRHADDAEAVSHYPMGLYYSFADNERADWRTARREVRLHYDTTRPDVEHRYVNGFHHRTGRRLTRIETYAPDFTGEKRLVHRYRLGYVNDSITGRSLLQDVTLCDARDTCLSPTVFTWTKGSFTFRENAEDDRGGAYADEVDPAEVPVFEEVHAADFNGDGRDDVLLKRREGSEWYVRLSNGSHFAPAVPAFHALRSSDPATSFHRSWSPVEGLLDSDHDGRVDVLLRTARGVFLYTWSDRRNGFEPAMMLAEPAWEPDSALTGYYGGVPGTAPPNSGFSGDVTGDGMADFIRRRKRAGVYYWTAWFGRRTGVAPFSAPFAPSIYTDFWPSPGYRAKTALVHLDGDGITDVLDAVDGKLRWFNLREDATADGGLTNLPARFSNQYLDVNGDGLTDFIDAWYGTLRMNTGRGFGPERPLTTPGASVYSRPRRQIAPADYPWLQPSGIVTGDFNNDGALDFMEMDNAYLHVARGQRFEVVGQPVRVPLPFDDEAYPYTAIDIDGNGVLDLLAYAGGQLTVFQRTGHRPDVITGVRNGLGRTDNVVYSTTTDPAVYAPSPYTCGYPQRCASRRMPVVRQLYEDNGAGQNVIDFTYFDGRTDLQGAGFVGFRRVRAYDRARQRWTEAFYENDDDEYGFYSANALPLRTTAVQELERGRFMVTTARRTLFKRWQFGDRVYLVRPRSETTRSYEFRDPFGLTVPSIVDGLESFVDERTPLHVVERTWDYDDYGYLVAARRAIDGGSQVEQTRTVEHRVADWRLGLTTETATTYTAAGGAAETRTHTFAYDAAGRIARRCIEEDHPALALCHAVERAPDGLVEAVRAWGGDTAERRVTTTWDDERVFPASTTNPLGHTTQFAYHPGLGVPVAVTDPNGIAIRYVYDGFGRWHEQRYPDGARITRSLTREGPGAYRTHVRGNDGAERYTNVDELGRPVEDGRLIGDAWSLTRRTYDAAGWLHRKSVPFFASDPAPVVTYTRDAAGRVTEITFADGSTTRQQFLPFETRFWDAAGNASAVHFDADGRVVRSVNTMADGRTLPTRYEYGVFGQLARVIDAGGNRVADLTYDARGRRTAVADLDAGTYRIGYNAFGEYTRETRPDGTVLTFERDGAGRLTAIHSPDGTTRFAWDTASRSDDGPTRGLLAWSESFDGVRRTRHYDALTRVAGETVTVGREDFRTDYAYDALGRLGTIRYPATDAGRFAVAYRYDDAGTLDAVVDAASDEPFWRAMHRGVWGRVTHAAFGNGLHLERTVDARTGRIERIASYRLDLSRPALVGRDYVQDLRYAYTPTGHLQTRQDRIQRRQETFSYDELLRLTGWNVKDARGAFAYAFRYDDLGNLTYANSVDGASSYEYGERRHGPHAVTAVDGAPLSYDALGRRTGGAGLSIDYNALHLPRTVRRGGAATHFRYDAQRRRVEKRVGATTDVYIDDLYERTRAGGAADRHRFFVWARGRVVAEVEASGGARTVRYLHPDFQGSPSYVADAGGRDVERRRYSPFGHRVEGTGTARVDFTGHRLDDDLGLIDMRGRVYDPATRRFLTPDPFVQQPAFGQSLNRYAYVLNAPLSFTDPTGFDYDYYDPSTDEGLGPEGDYSDHYVYSDYGKDPGGPPAYDDGYVSESFDGYGYSDGYYANDEVRWSEPETEVEVDVSAGHPDGVDRGGYTDDVPWSAPEEYPVYGPPAPPEPQISYHLPPRGEYGVIAVGGAAGGSVGVGAEAGGGVYIGLGRDIDIGTYETVGATAGSGGGASASLNASFNPGGVDDFSGGSAGVGGTIAPGVGVTGSVTGTTETAPTITVGVATGAEAEAHATGGYTWTQSSIDNTSRIINRYREPMMSGGRWVAYDGDNEVARNVLQPGLFGGPGHSWAETNGGQPNACIYPARPDRVVP